MKVRVFKDNAEISGYVNIPERISKRIFENGQEFYEKISEGVFRDAINRNDNIKLLLNHDTTRVLGTTKDELFLIEDDVGLFARCKIFDLDVVKKAKSGELVGWSFGFSPLKENTNENYSDYPLRTIDSLNLYEVSILDNNHTPAYNAMSLNVRNMGVGNIEVRNINKITIDKELESEKTFDNSIFIDNINNFLKERKK